MRKYRLVFEGYDSEDISVVTRSELMNGDVDDPVDLFGIGFTHEEQIKLIKLTQDCLISEQFKLKNTKAEYCPHCPNTKLIRVGRNKSSYHDIFTDHLITITRKQCPICDKEISSTVRTIMGGTISAELSKIQSELGAAHTFRESEQILARFACRKREINNHDRIKQTSETVGANVKTYNQSLDKILSIEPADELIINVDGGHIKTTEDGTRSFEAMAAVVYRPGFLVSDENANVNTITSKHCAASTENDNQQQMIANTIIAALKEGLCPNTKITALCDGAKNCWQIVDAFKPISASVLCILDWFHLSMKIRNIAMPNDLKDKLESIKWCLWHGKVDDAKEKLKVLRFESPLKQKALLEKLYQYIDNNSDKIINYDERKNSRLPYTSNLAESTVESLINKRCKGKQHMRWSRNGLDPILQLRAAITSNEWEQTWQHAVRRSLTIH